MMMSNPKRIHPVGVILSFISMVKSYIIPAILFFYVGDNESIKLYLIIGVVTIVVLLVITSVLSWYKFTYWVEEGEFRIEHGVFVRKKRYIPIERIQTINVSAGIIQQLFRLVKVQIETAGGGVEAEALLTAISKTEAERIQQTLTNYKQQQTVDLHNEEIQVEEKQVPTYKMSKKELLVAASTSSGIGVIISAIVAFLSQIDEFIPYDFIFDQFDFLTSASFTLYAILVCIGLFLAWIVSIIGVLLKYAYFTVRNVEDELNISRGIFEKRQTSIPISRIQAIRIVQNPIRQWLGYSTVYIESAGGSIGDENGSSTILFPVILKKDVTKILAEFIPGYPVMEETTKLPARSWKRYIIRKCLITLIIITPVSFLLFPLGLLSLLLLIGGFYWGHASFKDAGLRIRENQLQITYRFLSKTTVLLRKNRIQSMNQHTSLFQRKQDLATLKVAIKSGIMGKSFFVKDLERTDAEEVVRWYSYSKTKG